MDLGWDNLKLKYRLGREWIKTSSGEKDFVDEKLNMTQHCMFPAQNANNTLGYSQRIAASRSEEVILPLYFILLGPHLELWGLNTKMTCSCWSRSREKPLS